VGWLLLSQGLWGEL